MLFFGLSFISLLTLAVATCGTYKDPHFCNNRSVIVELFGWTFLDIAKECQNYLGPKGYGGVQVSPICASVVLKNRPWYEMYQPISYKINCRYGTQKEFEYMVKTCNQVGVRIYVDVVLNHMANVSKCLCYPDVPYTYEHFHLPECTINNYKNATEVRCCELDGCPDLDQSNDYVAEIQIEFLNYLIGIGVAGFRISYARHMLPADLIVIYNQLNNLSCDYGFPPGARPFICHHVVDDEGCCVSKWEYNNIGCVEERQFSSILSKLILGLKLGLILQIGLDLKVTYGLLPSLDAMVCVDDHYTQRGLYIDIEILTYKQSRYYKLAMILLLAYPYGYPRIMSSYDFDDCDQGPPVNSNGSICSPEFDDKGQCVNGFVCEHRFPEISAMVDFRNWVKNETIKNYWCNGKDQLAYSLGINAYIVINFGSSDLCQKLYTGLPDGTYCDILTGGLDNGKCCGKSVTVQVGFIDIKLLGNDALGAICLHVKEAILLNVNLSVVPLLGVKASLPIKL